MGTYVFRWTSPADEVYVTGTFDNWSKSVQLTKDSGIFTKQVDLASASEDVFYKFVVDGDWTVDQSQPTKMDNKGNENNLLRKEDIEPLPTGDLSHTGTHPTPNTASAIRSGVGPGATSAALAGAVPLENNRGASSREHMPGEFPSDSPYKEVPDIHRDGPSAMEFFSSGDIVPDFSTYKSATLPTDSSIQGDQKTAGNLSEKTVGDGAGVAGATAAASTATVEGVKKAGEATGLKGSEEGDQKFSVNPLPATSGIGNPVRIAPGEKLPPSSDYTTNTTTSQVKLDRESYEKSDAYPTSPNTNINTAAGTFGVPPVTSTTIPESSLPMGKDAVSSGPADVAAIRSAAGSNTTTSQLAGKVPLESRGVPEVVHKSQQEAGASPEAAANPTATTEKSKTENELKSKVPEEPVASSNDSTAKTVGAGVLATGASVASGATAAAAGVPSSISRALSSLTGSGSSEQAPKEVPQTVKDSERAAHTSPEAAANPVAVKDKQDFEKELTDKVPRSDAAGEPAPTFSVTQYASAPHPQEGHEGGRGKDHSTDAGVGKADDQNTSSSSGGKAAAIGAGITGAATAAGGAAYAATSKASETAKSTIQQSTSSSPGQNVPTSGTASSGSALAHDPTKAGSKRLNTDSGQPPVLDPSAASGGAKDAVSKTTTASNGGFARSSPLKDEDIIAAISAVNNDPASEASKAVKDDPVALKSGTGAAVAASALESEKDKTREADALNASKDQPAKSVVTEESKEGKQEERGPLPGTTMLPSSAKDKARQDSRDVSPMTKPEVTSGIDKAATEFQTKGKEHARNESSVTETSTADAVSDKKAKRRSFFGRIKDKLKHHE